MASVDPYIQRIPKKFLEDPETREWAVYLNRFLHDMWVRSGAGNDFIADSQTGAQTTIASINQIQQQIGSGDFLTVDTTGFTVDTSMIFADQVEA